MLALIGLLRRAGSTPMTLPEQLYNRVECGARTLAESRAFNVALLTGAQYVECLVMSFTMTRCLLFRATPQAVDSSFTQRKKSRKSF